MKTHTVMKVCEVIAVLGLVFAGTACESSPPDYASIWTSTPAAITDTAEDKSDPPLTIAQYLHGVGVTGEQIPLDELTDIAVTIPQPPGWADYSNPNFSPHTTIIAKNNTYPTAMVMVFKLTGNFDVAEALKHASAEAEISENFTTLNTSHEDFHGFPSAMIEGSYDVDKLRLHSYNRIVIPVTPAPHFQRYLVQLTITTPADQAVAQSDDIEAIIAGFTVELP